MEDISNQFSKDDIDKHTLMAILCYIGIFVIIPILQAKDSPFVRHNINQGLVMCLIYVSLSMFGAFLVFVPFGGLFSMVCSVGLAIVGVMTIINIINGKATKIAIISNFELIK